MNDSPPRNLAQVEAELSYIVPSAEKPVVYLYRPPPGVPAQSGRYEKRKVAIADARPIAPRLSLDVEGFRLGRHRTALRDFHDAAALTAVYYPEIERLAQAATGASRVWIFDHTLRASAPHSDGFGAVRTPVRVAHCDYTIGSGPQRVRDLLPAEEAAQVLRHRFAIVNIWQPLKGPVQEAPLAVCDARTVAPRELVGTAMKFPDRTGETYALAFGPAHRWYYFPLMGADEAVFMKTYDSATDGRARFAPHSAFDDPTTPHAAPRRESIETRMLLSFA
ncbi:MAG: CmcJ/NvfI family oxidoreductase [Dongiaceae bacterium]